MTDHERLCELLRRVYARASADTSIYQDVDAMLTRLRSDGPDGLRVVPVDQFAAATPLDVSKITGVMPDIEVQKKNMVYVSICGLMRLRASELRLFKEAGISPDPEILDAGGERADS